MAEDDKLPPEVQAQVDAAREEGEQQDQQAGGEEEKTETVRLTRREKAAQEKQAREEEERAAREAAKEAARLAKEANERVERNERESLERMARLEALLAGRQQERTTEVKEEREDKDDDWRDKYDRHQKKAKEALAAGDMDEYHERMTKAAVVRAKAEMRKDMPKPQPQQQVQQKPPWLGALEAQFSDVVLHPQGLQAVSAFAQLNTQGTPQERVQKAFERARQELGLKKHDAETNQRQRQMMGTGGRVQAQRSGSTGPAVRMPANWREVARRAGMSAEDYARAYAESNPDAVER